MVLCAGPDRTSPKSHLLAAEASPPFPLGLGQPQEVGQHQGDPGHCPPQPLVPGCLGAPDPHPAQHMAGWRGCRPQLPSPPTPPARVQGWQGR